LPNIKDAEESYTAVVNAYERVPQPNLESMKRLQKLLAQLNPKVAEVRVENLIDNSFMNKLESSGYIQGLYKKH
jgi:bifunctional DNase/RNase